MHLYQRQISISAWLALSLAFAMSVAALGDEPIEPVQAVQGKWVRHQATADGPVTIVKEHKGRNTVVTAFDDQKNVIYAHESEFQIEQSGKVRVFTFSNRTITAGPHAGRKIKEPVSFIYRVVENRFIEVHGVLEGDAEAPNMIVWDRLEDAAEGKDAA